MLFHSGKVKKLKKAEYLSSSYLEKFHPASKPKSETTSGWPVVNYNILCVIRCKVMEWHTKMEELHLQELKLSRELVKQKEEVKYLRNIISEYECTISNLEEENVQQNKVCITPCY